VKPVNTGYRLGARITDLQTISEEQRVQLLVSAVTDYAIYMLDPGGRIATWNPGAQRFKGYSADEIVGEHFSRFYTEEDQASDLPARALRIAARDGKFEAEGWRVRKDSTRFWAHVVVDPIRGDDGKLLGFAKITRDVTDRKRQEEALYESEQRFRLLVEGVRDYAIYMLDQNGIITNWNSGAEAIKGYSAEEIVGHHFSRFYTDHDRASGEPQRALETALREGKYEREAWRVRKDGSLFWANVVIDPIYNEAGQHIGFAKITRDATERKRAQEELEHAREALAQSHKLQALGELTGGIAHDFNNLLTVIAGSADFVLRRRDLPEEKKIQYLKGIVETTARATSLTNHLLAFGRRQPIKPEVTDVNARLKSFSEVLARTLGRQIQVALDLDPNAGNIEVDIPQFETAILNAALNARDAMSGEGRLTLSSKRESHDGEEMVRIGISDTGMGMPQRVLERAFEPFFTTKQVGKGTGLGLSQIHGFAAQAGGRAELQSSEGAGTTVFLLLPHSAKALAEGPGSAPLARLPKGLKVLLVEDNPEVREFACGLLKDLGCEVVLADSAERALELLESADPDLVFSDVVMPGASGIALASDLRRLRPDLPVLLTTGYSDELIKGLPDATVLVKPYGSEQLGEAIAGLLGAKGEKAA
jgi:PAS domain S-box-containing protein